MSRSITLHIEAFGQDALEAAGDGGARTEVVRTAALYYLGDREAGRLAWPVPRLLKAAERTGRKLEVELDDETVAALEQEAERQDVKPGQLAQHALMYFLADLDSGRVSDLIGQELDEGLG